MAKKILPLEAPEPEFREGDTVYLDEMRSIREALDQTGFVVVIDNHNCDKQIRSGITITSDDCRTQAEWSIGRRKYMPKLLDYLTLMPGYHNWTLETLQIRTSFSKQDKQLIGLIELLYGTWLHYSQQGNGSPLLFLEEPETHLHPKQCTMLITLLTKIRKDTQRK